jgi:hypothetical protein
MVTGSRSSSDHKQSVFCSNAATSTRLIYARSSYKQQSNTNRVSGLEGIDEAS